MHTLGDINVFLAHRRVALIGVSTDPKDFTRVLARELAARGYEIVPVNPKATEMDGRPCYSRLRDVNSHVQAAIILTPASASAQVVRECHEAGVHNVWLYRGAGTGAVSAEAVGYGREHGLNLIAGECPFMFLPHSGWIHRLHGGIRILTRSYPKSAD